LIAQDNWKVFMRRMLFGQVKSFISQIRRNVHQLNTSDFKVVLLISNQAIQQKWHNNHETSSSTSHPISQKPIFRLKLPQDLYQYNITANKIKLFPPSVKKILSEMKVIYLGGSWKCGSNISGEKFESFSRHLNTNLSTCFPSSCLLSRTFLSRGKKKENFHSMNEIILLCEHCGVG
jgi:hypothetical protein